MPKHHHHLVKVIAILAVAAIVIVALLRDKFVNNPQWQVTVVGQGKVTYVPDTATISIGVQVDKAFTAESALRQVNERISKIIAAVQAAGVPTEDIQTQNYSVYPQYDYANNISYVGGYNANQQLSVKVRNFKNDSSLISKVLDEASKAGANQIYGVTFEASDINELRQEARLKALDDAKEKAGALANRAGIRLGKIVGWYENFAPGPVPYYGEGRGGGGAVTPQLPVGANELIVEMNVNYRIK